LGMSVTNRGEKSWGEILEIAGREFAWGADMRKYILSKTDRFNPGWPLRMKTVETKAWGM